MNEQEKKSPNVLKIVLIVFGLLLIFGCLAAAAAIIVPAALFQQQVGEAQGDRARVQAQSIQSAALLYMVELGSCPSMDDLEGGGFYHAVSGDPWGTPYRVECSDDQPTVISAGPDASFGTADDITVE